MPQRSALSALRRLAWRIVPAPVLNRMFGDRLRGMSQLILASEVAKARPVDLPDVDKPCYRLDLEDGTVILSTDSTPNNIKITAAARDTLKLGPEYARALVDLIVRYRYPHALVPVLEIPVPDRQRGGFHLQHRNLPQETTDFNVEQRAFLRDNFTVGSGWNIVDIGCYLGHGATHLGQRVGPDGRVIAVEAIPSNARIAKHQIEHNALSNVTVMNRAIWKESGTTIAMNVTEDQANAIAGDVISSSNKVDLETTSIAALTDMLGRAADLVSLTVNGAEVEALDSLDAMDPALRPHRLVMPGWYPTDKRPRSEILDAKLRELGYETLVTKHRFVIAWRGLS